MKDFLLMFKGTNYADMGLSPDELRLKLSKWWEWQQKMEAKGILKGGNALQSGIRRIEGPNRSITDQSSAELTEVIGGYFAISVADLKAATEVAQDYPDFEDGGVVEIREVMNYGS